VTLDDFARALVAGARVFIERAEEALEVSARPIANGSAGPEPLLVKRAIALRLGVSTATVDRYVKQGMPFTSFGSSKRFGYATCEAWIKARPVLRAAPALPMARCLSTGSRRHAATKNG
jgi:predicted DNA-binding transcriptional regulator AlpA